MLRVHSRGCNVQHLAKLVLFIYSGITERSGTEIGREGGRESEILLLIIRKNGTEQNGDREGGREGGRERERERKKNRNETLE